MAGNPYRQLWDLTWRDALSRDSVAFLFTPYLAAAAFDWLFKLVIVGLFPNATMFLVIGSWLIWILIAGSWTAYIVWRVGILIALGMTQFHRNYWPVIKSEFRIAGRSLRDMLRGR
ncbi:hypothetical protein [Sphingomonas baiyangensis]|uniref:Uncharacterized protein n=1 Tax=Sphingomonas baiyangensis TaxID=2572576 RepID=A0A4U1LA17_9SPHN|nr:hypothetical protein [Sphingomonas baiyangensis]TKD53186.1 hypothetical protein FBR43_02325 [Sphingomonas baiyangensis]